MEIEIILASLIQFFFLFSQIFRVSPIQSDEEQDSHKLEVEHCKLLIRKMNDKENAAIGANNYGNYKQKIIYVIFHLIFTKSLLGRFLYFIR